MQSNHWQARATLKQQGASTSSSDPAQAWMARIWLDTYLEPSLLESYNPKGAILLTAVSSSRSNSQQHHRENHCKRCQMVSIHAHIAGLHRVRLQWFRLVTKLDWRYMRAACVMHGDRQQQQHQLQLSQLPCRPPLAWPRQSHTLSRIASIP